MSVSGLAGILSATNFAMRVKIQIMKSYQKSLFENAPFISQLESSLRSISFILPGRFKGSDLASTVLFSAVSLYALLNDQIVHSVIPPSRNLFNRYTCDLLKNKTLSAIAFLSQFVEHTTIVYEMTAKYFGDGADDTILIVQIIREVNANHAERF